MLRFVKLITSAMLTIALCAPTAGAMTSGDRPGRGHGDSGRHQRQHGGSHQRGNQRHESRNHNRHDNNRPGNRRQDNKHHNTGRPGNKFHDNKGHDFKRPDNKGHDFKRPDNKHHDNKRPGFNRPDNHRPGAGMRPGRHPIAAPQPPMHFNKHHHAPHHAGPRPHAWRPPYRPLHRPPRPHGWHPRHRVSFVDGILGLTFGITLNAAINELSARGVNVTTYNGNTIYLDDVYDQGYLWPSATMYYGATGMQGSSFYFTTGYNDPSRYNSLYSVFTARYGSPFNVVRTASRFSATWFGYDRGYITLTYAPENTTSGPLFLTTLTYGI